jgi:hypothetical protein
MDIFPGGITANFNANALLSCRNRIYFQDTNFVLVLVITVFEVAPITTTIHEQEHDAQASPRKPNKSNNP